MSIALSVQKAIRARLVSTSAVTDLVPASHVLDAHTPDADPSIVIGEAQIIDEGMLHRRSWRTFHDLHVWRKEPGLQGANAIGGAIQTAIAQGIFELDAGYHCADARTSGIRSMRDPDGETSHAIVTVESLVFEVPA